MFWKGKTVVVTGGSQGVGAEVARLFAAEGANLVLVARNRGKLEFLAKQLKEKTSVAILNQDVSDIDKSINIFRFAESEFGKIHVLINNAGYHSRGNFNLVTSDQIAQMIDVNFRAPILLTKQALPYIIKAGSGAIVNVGSLAGRTPLPGAAVYSATKAGLRAFTYALREELINTNIKVAIISPGPIKTQFIMADIDKTTDLTFSQPLSLPKDIAIEIFKLCSDKKTEKVIPTKSGWLTQVTYLFPKFGRLIRPILERKGKLKKEVLKKDVS